MVLRQGDTGDSVKKLQRDLNRVGSLLLVDGQFGQGTHDAVIDARVALKLSGPPEADEMLQSALAIAPDLFPPLTAAGVTFIGRAEVTGPAEYRRKYQVPSWPSRTSGITIGIGYDCQFVNREQFLSDWSSLSRETLDALLHVLGCVGSEERLATLRSVVIPLQTAVPVFARTLETYLRQTQAIYPQVDQLTPARRTALVSLIYNRGNRLTDSNATTMDRREMRAIQDLLASGESDSVADQLDAMARLWDPQSLAGLIQRRHDEATLWRSGFGAFQLA